MPKIFLIAAVDRSMALGFENKLLYWLPNDLKRFKALTTGHTIIMGRKTFESLPNGALPNRRNIILSSSGITYPNAETFPSIEAALRSCRLDEEVFIIGGASVYEQTLPLAEGLFITEIDGTALHADAFFPAITSDIWQEKSRDAHPADDKHPCSYAFVDYVRR